MATIQKRQTKKGTSYRVLIRQKGSNPISKTFDSRVRAQSFIHKVESNPNHLSIITKTDIPTYLDIYSKNIRFNDMAHSIMFLNRMNVDSDIGIRI